MTWINAFDAGICTVEVRRQNTLDYSGVLGKGDSADVPDDYYSGITVAVSSDGMVSLQREEGVEDPFDVRVVPSYDLDAMHGLRLVAPLSGTGSGNATSGSGDAVAFTNGDAVVDLSDNVAWDWLGLTMASGLAGDGSLLSFTPEVDSVEPDYPCSGPLLEVWQPPSSAYKLRIRGYAQAKSFSEDDDQTTVDARLVFMLALANAKAHYRHPDAQNYLNQVQLRLRKMRARLHNDQRYTMRREWSPPPMPKILGIDD